MLEEMSRIHVLDQQTDEMVVYTSDHYVCLMKLFPMCQSDEEIPNGDYRRFHMRFYIPREYFTDAHKKIDEILVMTNGLDEFSHYTLYDELGSRFASNGLPVVLLPLPHHLHRHTRYRVPKATARQITEKPSEIMMRNPIKLYERFLQFKGELAQLRNHIARVECGKSEASCAFYHHLFAPQVKVSYMGYSLGAAAMLSDFLEAEDSLHACFLLNGAIKLNDILSEKMFPQREWDKFIGKLEEEYRELAYHELAAPNRLFEAVFLGQYVSHTRDLLLKHAHRVLFIFGGRDSLTSYKNLEAISPRQWGSGMLVLPGISHFLGVDEQWKKWISLVVRLILEFKANALRRTFTKEELLRQHEHLEAELDQLSLAELAAIQSQHHRASLIGMDPKELARQEDEKRKIKELVGSKSFEELPLGLMLYQARMITVDELLKALEVHHLYKVRIGDVFADNLKVVTRDHIEALVKVQIRQRSKDKATKEPKKPNPKPKTRTRSPKGRTR